MLLIPSFALLSALLPFTTATSLKRTLTLSIPPSALLPNPAVLPPSTHATLSTLGGPSHSAPLSTRNTFVFHNVTSGSYLADVHCGSHAFAPLRMDVLEKTVAATAGGEPQQKRLGVRVWETFRGNEWDNKGEEVKGDRGGFVVRVLGEKNYFVERGSFSVLSILKNPMILIGMVSMGVFIVMPKLVDNMDPEMRAEWEEQQKNNPMTSLMGGGKGGGNSVSNFDMAAFLSGTDKKGEGPATPGNGAGGKKGRR